MSIIQSAKETGSSASPLSAFEQAMEAVAIGGKHQKEADFAEAYPTIEQHLARKVPQKLLLSKFNEAYGHALHPPGFRKLLDEERKRREHSGDIAVCSMCGKRLSTATLEAQAMENVGVEGVEA